MATDIMTPLTRPVIRGTQHCPTCGLPSDRTHSYLDGSVNSVTLLCAQAHVWNVRWPVAS